MDKIDSDKSKNDSSKTPNNNNNPSLFKTTTISIISIWKVHDRLTKDQSIHWRLSNSLCQ